MTKPERKRKMRTGVTHFRPTIAGYEHEKPSKVEAMMARVNLRSPDVLSGGGGGGKSASLSSGEILSAFAGASLAVRSVDSKVGANLTKEAIYRLAMYKHTGEGLNEIHAIAISIMAAIARRDGWLNAEADGRKGGPDGPLARAALTAVLDVCYPQRFVDVSASLWASTLGLPGGHKDWQRKWRSRYDELRGCLQELDSAGEEQINRRI